MGKETRFEMNAINGTLFNAATYEVIIDDLKVILPSNEAHKIAAMFLGQKLKECAEETSFAPEDEVPDDQYACGPIPPPERVFNEETYRSQPTANTDNNMVRVTINLPRTLWWPNKQKFLDLLQKIQLGG